MRKTKGKRNLTVSLRKYDTVTESTLLHPSFVVPPSPDTDPITCVGNNSDLVSLLQAGDRSTLGRWLPVQLGLVTDDNFSLGSNFRHLLRGKLVQPVVEGPKRDDGFLAPCGNPNGDCSGAYLTIRQEKIRSGWFMNCYYR